MFVCLLFVIIVFVFLPALDNEHGCGVAGSLHHAPGYHLVRFLLARRLALHLGLQAGGGGL